MRNRSIGSLILSPTAFTLALGVAATSEAALVPFDLNSMGLSGQNAGLTNGTGKLVYPWTVSAAFVVGSQAPPSEFFTYPIRTGFRGLNGMEFAVTSAAACSPQRLVAGDITSASLNWRSDDACLFKQVSSASASAAAPIWGGGSYLGFRYRTNWGYRYGYLEVTWDGTNFRVLSGVHESSFNTPVSIPVPAPAAITVLGAAGLVGSRRRRP